MAFYNELNQYQNQIACIDAEGRQITYSELCELSHEVGRYLRECTLVFSFCSNTIGAIIGYVSFLSNKVVPLLLNVEIDAELRAALINLYKPSYIYIPKTMINEFANWNCLWEVWDYCLLENPEVANVELYSELALLLTTSGSTGSPKLVKQSYENIQSNAKAIAEYLELDVKERPITTLPMNYTYGLSIINSHLLVGATILLTEHSITTREFWNFFKAENATSFGGVPYTYEILRKIRFFGMDLPSLRTMTQAGGKLSPELHKEFAEYAQKQGKHFVVMYGQTEATARMGYLPWERAIEKYGSMGIAIPGGKLWLKGVDGKEITQPDVAGELVYEGKNVTLGYAICPEDLAKGDERKGILETGDMARMDSEGYFYIVGRKKRFIKIFGNRVNLDEVEGLIKTEYKGLECACAGVDDQLYVFIVDSDRIQGEEIKKFLVAKTGLNSLAFSIKCIDSIPKNDAGKIQYKYLEEYYD